MAMAAAPSTHGARPATLSGTRRATPATRPKVTNAEIGHRKRKLPDTAPKGPDTGDAAAARTAPATAIAARATHATIGRSRRWRAVTPTAASASATATSTATAVP